VLTEAEALRSLAEVTGEIGEADLTTTLLRESEEKYRELGHGVYLADALNSFGYLALRNGNHERARKLFEEAVQILRDLGASPAVAGFLQSLSDAYRASGDYKGAAVRCREGLVLAQETENTRAVADCINALAGLAVEIGRHEEAARLFGAVDTMRKTVGPLGSRYEDERHSRDMAAVRDALGAEAEFEARSAGQALPLEQAVREALALADDVVRDSARSPLLHSAGETS
jgi:tetratricopeptide (TPR) repeat protein